MTDYSDLIAELRDFGEAWSGTETPRISVVLQDAAEALDRLTAPPTDEQVEAADAAWWAHPDISGGLDCMRAALEAARDAS